MKLTENQKALIKILIGAAVYAVAIITRGPTRGDAEATHQLDAPLGPTLTELATRLGA